MENEEILEQSGAQEEAKTQTFDEVLANKDYQAEFDKRISKALDTARSKWEAERKANEDEAKKLAKMNAEQKAQHEKEQLEKRIAELETERTLNTMRLTAQSMLAEKGLTISNAVIDQIVSTDAEKTKIAVDEFGDAVQKMLSDMLEERLKGTTQKRGTNFNAMTKEEILSIKDRQERQRLIAENIALFS